MAKVEKKLAIRPFLKQNRENRPIGLFSMAKWPVKSPPMYFILNNDIKKDSFQNIES